MRRTRNNLMLAMLACLAASAQTAPPSGEPATVSGIVNNSVSGEPILRAHVTLRTGGQSQQIYGALTDAEGKFTIMQVPAGSYAVAVEKTGYQPPLQFNAPALQLKLDAAEKKEGVKLKLTPGGSISGRVLDSTGEPVEGASVRVSPNTPGAVTDAKGRFRIGGLRPGKYRVLAAEGSLQLPFPIEIRTDGTTETFHGRTYYPSSLTPKDAARLALGPGAELAGIDIRLVRIPVVRISGKVVGVPARAMPVNVQVQSADPVSRNFSVNGRSKPDGTFEVWRAGPGKYRLTSFFEGSQTLPVEIEVGESDIENLELKAVPPVDLTGFVQFEDEQAKLPDPSKKPPPGSTRQMQQTPVGSSPTPPRTLLYLQDVTSGMFGRRLQATVQPDGSFALPQVAAGKYAVTTNWGPTYVKSMQLGATQMEGRILDLRFGTGGNPVTVLVASTMGEITGIVRTGADPAPQGTVVMLLSDPPGAQPLMSVVGTDGTYGYPKVPPGKYRLGVVERDDQSLNVWERSADDFEELTDVLVLPGDKIAKDLRTAR